MLPSSLSFLASASLLAIAGLLIDPAPLPAQELGRSSWSDSQCVSCHRSGSGLSHPVDVPFLGTQILPSSRGRLGCLSCHDQRAASPGHTSLLPGSGRNLLRLPTAQLCRSCHDQPLDPGGPVAHAISLGRAHLQGAWKDSFGAVLVAQPRFGLDQESRSCLSCHDGTTAGIAAIRAPGQAALPPVGMLASRDHPIGVRYSSFPKGSMAPQYRPESTLPDPIRLFGGNVGCGSCHSPYAGQEELMAVDPRRGNLCLKCHVK